MVLKLQYFRHIAGNTCSVIPHLNNITFANISLRSCSHVCTTITRLTYRPTSTSHNEHMVAVLSYDVLRF